MDSPKWLLLHSFDVKEEENKINPECLPTACCIFFHSAVFPFPHRSSRILKRHWNMKKRALMEWGYVGGGNWMKRMNWMRERKLNSTHFFTKVKWLRRDSNGWKGTGHKCQKREQEKASILLLFQQPQFLFINLEGICVNLAVEILCHSILFGILAFPSIHQKRGN